MIDIKGYEGRYRISKDGKVYSLLSGKFLKPSNNVKGYPAVSLRDGKRGNTKMVHRLVVEHYLKKPKWAQCVNHKDGNKENNHLDNLEWSTHSLNVKHAYDNKLAKKILGQDLIHSKLRNKDVLNIIEGISDGFKYKTIADFYNVHPETISSIARGKSWSWLTGIGGSE